MPKKLRARLVIKDDGGYSFPCWHWRLVHAREVYTEKKEGYTTKRSARRAATTVAKRMHLKVVE